MIKKDKQCSDIIHKEMSFLRPENVRVYEALDRFARVYRVMSKQ